MSQETVNYNDVLSASVSALAATIDKNTDFNQFPTKGPFAYLAQQVNLSPAEQSLVLALLGLELDSTFRQTFLKHSASESSAFSIGNFVSMFKDLSLSTFAEVAPLRRLGLIDISRQGLLLDQNIKLSEWALFYLLDAPYIDTEIAGVGMSDSFELPLPERYQSRCIQEVSERLGHIGQSVILNAEDTNLGISVAKQAAAQRGFELRIFQVENLVPYPQNLIPLARKMDREFFLNRILYCFVLAEENPKAEALLRYMEESLDCPFLCTSTRPYTLNSHIPKMAIDIPNLAHHEKLTLLLTQAGPQPLAIENDLAALLFHYQLNISDIMSLSKELAGTDPQRAIKKSELSAQFQRRLQPSFGELAKAIPVKKDAAKIRLPDYQHSQIQSIISWVKNRHEVFGDWGFDAHRHQSHGISVVFSGASGTGKSSAAQWIAAELDLPLYRVNIDTIVSKYIGETEKNLRIIFEQAENSGAILLFDEADALFGKRSDVNQSNDRYANMGVSYLLQRLDAFSGLCILTTNLKNSMDAAFTRRFSFVVHFPFPDQEQRRLIWETGFPDACEKDPLDLDALSRFNLSGGSISNICLQSAFIAIKAKEKISMRHVMEAVEEEHKKQDKQWSNLGITVA